MDSHCHSTETENQKHASVLFPSPKCLLQMNYYDNFYALWLELLFVFNIGLLPSLMLLSDHSSYPDLGLVAIRVCVVSG